MELKKENDFFKTTLVGEAIWSIDGPANDLMYLITGAKKALLIDTGMGIGDLAGLVKSLTSLPLTVVNTHGHPDHAGGNSNFDEVWMTAEDEAMMRRMTTLEYRTDDVKAFHGETSPQAKRFLEALVPARPWKLRVLQPGQVFDLGGRQFEVLALPGHTPGSICLLNTGERLLFCGDSMVATPVWLYLEQSMPLKVYRDALIRINAKITDNYAIFPNHQPTPLGRDTLLDLIVCVEEVLAKPGIGEPTKTFAGEGLLWAHGKGQVIYNPANLT